MLDYGPGSSPPVAFVVSSAAPINGHILYPLQSNGCDVCLFVSARSSLRREARGGLWARQGMRMLSSLFSRLHRGNQPHHSIFTSKPLIMKTTTELEKGVRESATYLQCFRGTEFQHTEIASVASVVQAFCGSALMQCFTLPNATRM